MHFVLTGFQTDFFSVTKSAVRLIILPDLNFHFSVKCFEIRRT